MKRIRYGSLYRYTRESPCRAHAPRRSLLLRVRAARYNVITGRCYAAGCAPRDKRRIGQSREHAHLERLFRTAKNCYERGDEGGGALCETYTWAVITASAVRPYSYSALMPSAPRHTAILAPESLLFRLVLSERCFPTREEEKMVRVSRELV